MDENLKSFRKKIIPIYKEILDRNKFLFLQAKGRSMFPIMRQGNQAIICRLEKDNFKIGDLILYQNPKNENAEPIIHRIVRKKSDNTFIAKGDSSFGCDPPVQIDYVLGRVVGIKKKDKLIPLDGALGRGINLFFYLFSVTNILPATVKFLRFALKRH